MTHINIILNNTLFFEHVGEGNIIRISQIPNKISLKVKVQFPSFLSKIYLHIKFEMTTFASSKICFLHEYIKNFGCLLWFVKSKICHIIIILDDNVTATRLKQYRRKFLIIKSTNDSNIVPRYCHSTKATWKHYYYKKLILWGKSSVSTNIKCDTLTIPWY